jgi:hypothetical protein
MAGIDPLERLDRQLKRLETLCRAARLLSPDAPEEQRLGLVVDLQAERRAMVAVRADLRNRLARSRETRQASYAYDSAQTLRLVQR